ncbi:MAG: hypothetical protein HEQ21_07610 [Blastomonas sp.]|uniref:hypothetical protein n=1 Tax=Blastomonas sp. TaxID=1909299 RepID=UPI00258395FC|nr:hypothetical protein [Blastomonas sp.]MCO5792670.1 hypothetical protein [Blastomonas sp.]
MSRWTVETLRALDLRYAEQGLHLHQRPFRAAMEILGPAFVIGVGGNPEVQKIMDAYAEMIPEVDDNWPGMGVGLVAVVDQVRRFVVPVVFGSPGPINVWAALGFSSQEEWWRWCREDRDMAARTSFAFADVADLTYGLDDMRSSSAPELTLWKMATSNLADAANGLPTTFSVDSMLQPICMTAELSLKAALVKNGADPGSFKGPAGHDLKKLMERMARETPHRDDATATDIVARLPAYVASRYAPAGLNRLQVVRLALGVQFLAASTVRRFASRDLAAEMEAGDWPAPRRPFFPN